MDAMRQVYHSSVSSGNMKRSIRELKNKVRGHQPTKHISPPNMHVILGAAVGALYSLVRVFRLL